MTLTAKPYLSLIAIEEDRTVRHILFNNAWILNETAKITMLAPLAVFPKYQKQGIGGKLIKIGLQKLYEAKVDLFFVVGPLIILVLDSPTHKFSLNRVFRFLRKMLTLGWFRNFDKAYLAQPRVE